MIKMLMEKYLSVFGGYKRKGIKCGVLTLLISLSSGAVTTSTASEFYNDKNIKEANRWEGYVHQKVGSKFRLISIRRGGFPNFGQGDVLSAHFYLPKDERLVLSARKLKSSGKKYYMEAMQKDWGKGWQSFSPWGVDHFIVTEGISNRNIGVSVKGDSSYYPPQILKSGDSVSSNNYAIHFYTPTSISGINYILSDKDGKEVLHGNVGSVSGKRVFKIKLPMSKSLEGEYLLSLDIKWKHDPGRHNSVVNFYHIPI